MASLQQEPTGMFHVVFRVHGKRYKRSLGTKNETKASARQDEIAETIRLIKQKKINTPSHVPIAEFVLKNGVVSPVTPPPENAPLLSLASLFEQFFASLPEGSVEESTKKMNQIHERHLLRIMRPDFEIASLTGQHLQEYVNARAKEKTQYLIGDVSKSKRDRRPVSATTIRKELVTLGTVWRWATSTTLLSGDFPNRGLRFPKTDEKPPFQTWAEIERHIEVGKLNSCDADTLWECLFLRSDEIDKLLEYVKEAANSPFIYPMFAMAAFTGARRSELMRSQRVDFNFDQKFVTIRERKRVRGRRSTRRVPISDRLNEIMLEWFSKPEAAGAFTFAQLKEAGELKPITPDQAHSHFRQTVRRSKWNKIKGWHCLRHSFISNLACAGIDQRIIDEFVGHSTEEMRRRYRHLFPDVKQAAINQVFG